MKAKYLTELRQKRRLRKELAEVQNRKKRKQRYSVNLIENPCAICGIREATTRDHVPPKCIFPSPRPEVMITVPACSKCNNGASDFDDLFKVYLSMQAAENNALGTRLFHEKTLRTLGHNNALLRKIQEETREIEVVNKNGVLETKTGILWNSKAHDAVIERTVRGLYYYHKGSCVPVDTNLKLYWFHSIPEGIDPDSPLFSSGSVGENQFNYKYIIYNEDPRRSIWLFEFYGVHWAGGYIEPRT